MSVSDEAAGTNSLGFTDSNNGTDYSYDDNGNMVLDRNKGIGSITYNYRNQIKKITGNNNKTIEYIYSAGGQKLAKKAPDGTMVYYSGNFIYEGGVLKRRILNAAGKYEASGSAGEISV